MMNQQWNNFLPLFMACYLQNFNFLYTFKIEKVHMASIDTKR